MNPKVEKAEILSALSSFKDWSNYLLVTTVAALGWVATSHEPGGILRALIIGFLGSSIVFGIFTLALIPLVTEGIGDHEFVTYTMSALPPNSQKFSRR